MLASVFLGVLLASGETGAVITNKYSWSGKITCWGPGTYITDVEVPVGQIVNDVLNAANASVAACTNPGSYNNIYEFNRQTDLTLWFNCYSVTNCGNNSINNFALVMSCPANSSYDSVQQGCVCAPGYVEYAGDCAKVIETYLPPPCLPCLFNPIYPLTGAKREAIDTGVTLGGISLTLAYDSTPKLPSNVGVAPTVFANPNALGALWTTNLHRKLQISPDSKKALLSRGDGSILSFTGNGSGAFTGDANNTHKLAAISGGYAFSDVNNASVETFDGSGKLLTLTPAGGQPLTFTYSGNNLVRVQSGDGRALKLTYNTEGLITQVTTAEGRTLAMGYDANKNLTSLTKADNKTYGFAYENTALPWALTGKIDENNSRYATFGYDAEGRVISGEHAGAEQHSVSYGTPPRRIVTETYDAPNKTLYRVHGWEAPTGTIVGYPNGTYAEMDAVVVGGMMRLQAQSQPAASGSAASEQNQTYDSNGNILSKDSFDGHRSCYSYDANNRETVRVEGLATSVACASVTPGGASLPSGARKTTTTWHPDWALAAQQAQPLRTTTTVHHGQPDPFNGNATANCTSAAALANGKARPVICKQVQQATLANGSVDTTVAARSTTYTYNALGQITSSVDPRGQTTTYAYYSDTVLNGGAYDPSIDLVTLLLHGNGANNATTITDDSPAQRSLTRVGDTKISTAASKHGGASLLFDGAGDYITVPSSTDFDFGSGDFTIEMWIKTTQTTTYSVLLGKEWGAAPYSGGFTIFLSYGSGGPLALSC